MVPAASMLIPRTPEKRALGPIASQYPWRPEPASVRTRRESMSMMRTAASSPTMSCRPSFERQIECGQRNEASLPTPSIQRGSPEPARVVTSASARGSSELRRHSRIRKLFRSHT
eukprot:Amastigsp_a842199_34.p2 type:complete len:115 gc:universal Amastigsp_a842199_34:649-993(+)